MTLALIGGSQGQQKAKPVGFISLHTFQLNGITFDEVMKHLKLNIPIPLLIEIYVMREITAVLLTATKDFNIGMHVRHLQTNLVQTWCNNCFYSTLYLLILV